SHDAAVIAGNEGDDLSAVAQANVEAILQAAAPWIASRSLSSGAHSRDPSAGNDENRVPHATN
ncbi:MAG TPA: hypothetical protein VNZ26_18955, partial [Vicinamibacterales bacterium]|nr:hypothetical protein [Vicinamibacterales bacterium]